MQQLNGQYVEIRNHQVVWAEHLEYKGQLIQFIFHVLCSFGKNSVIALVLRSPPDVHNVTIWN